MDQFVYLCEENGEGEVGEAEEKGWQRKGGERESWQGMDPSWNWKMI